jgi:hypothetical protein
MSYVLPSRKAFSDFVTRIFKNYRDTSKEAQDVDLCENRVGPGKELLPYQKLVRDYLIAETPYRGLLIYHGLGSGKTCSAIAVAESLLDTRKIFVMLPTSLEANFRGELRKCGDPFYQEENHWEVRKIRTSTDIDHARSLGISQKYLDKHMEYYVTVHDKAANFKNQALDVRKKISEQIEDVLNQKFTFIHYDGIQQANIDRIFPPDQPDQLNDSVIIIDEIHNFIRMVLNESELKMRIYNLLYKAKNSKLVLLSGTPIINKPNEIAYLMNLLRGPIERITIPTKPVSWDEGMMTGYFRSKPEIDTIEYNSVKKQILLTRNPEHFESVYNEKNERIAVKHNKELIQKPFKEWIESMKQEIQQKFSMEIGEPTTEELECLPTKFEEFANTYIDGLKIKNALMFQRRIQGLVSYFKGADERLLPKRIETEKEMVRVEMSTEQFLHYLEVRWKEIQQDSRRGRGDDLPTYRTNSRLVCNYALPPDFIETSPDSAGIQRKDGEATLEKIRKTPKRFLTPEALKVFSPKFLQISQNIKKFAGEHPYKNQFVYSQFKSLEGSGILGLILEQEGFQEYKLEKTQSGYVESPDMDPSKPAFTFFRGETSESDELERNYTRQIFNQSYEDGFPASLKDSLKTRICVIFGSTAGKEGITLRNVRDVHIVEAQWNPGDLEQAIGRANRICSHASLPMDERTFRVHIYVTVFSQEQTVGIEGPNIVLIRRNDMVLKRYDSEQPVDTFMSTDEYMYEKAYEKDRLIKNLNLLLKQAAVDCEIHRKLHSRNGEVLQCMRFDTTSKSEDLAFQPNARSDEPDTFYLRNVIRRKRRLQKVRVLGFELILDPDSQEIFDAQAYEDNKRLLKLGIKQSNEIIWFRL